MKNSSEPSPKTRSYQNTSLNLTQSLFMDETSADLENYLNSSLPETSTVTSDQELECSTINALSKSITGKFQKSSRDSKKNKFFKSKSLEDNLSVNSNEIPVINEAMKKIFKETPYQPNLKHTPKVLKTYSNKHKDKKKIVESFGLPDEPIYSVDSSCPKEQNSIDLAVEPDNNFNNSLALGQLMPSNELQSSEVTLNDEFRSKSFSTIDTVLFSGGSLEADVKEGFNFEEDNMIQEYASESLNERNVGNQNRSPIVLMKSLNLNDIRLLETNNLSPSNNGREMLLDRWHKFSLKLKNDKGFQKSNTLQGTSKGSGLGINNAKRSTRSHTSNIEFGSSSTKNSDIIKRNLEKNACDKDLVLEDNSSPKVQRKYESSEDKKQKIPNNINIFSPRRITRRSAQQTVDSLPININNATCSPTFKSPVRKNGDILDDISAVNNDKKDKNSKITVAVDNEEKSMKNDCPSNNPPENVLDITSPHKLSRNIRTSLRSSNSSKKLQSKMESSPPFEQKLVQNHSSTSKRKGYFLQKELKNLLAEAQSSLSSELVDNLSLSGLEGCVKIMNLDDKMSSPAESKQFKKTKNLDQERDTPIRKSNRLKLYSNEKNSDESMSTPSNNEVSHVQVKRSSKGYKKKESEIQDISYSAKSLENGELCQKSNTEKEITQNPLAVILDKVSKNTECSVSCLGSTKIDSIRLHQSNEETITNEGDISKENYNDIQINGKIQDVSKQLNSTKKLDQESDTPIRKSNRLKLYSYEKNTAENKSPPSNNEVSHVQVKRSSNKSRKKPSEIQDTSFSAKSLEDEELTQKSSTEKVISQNPLLIRIDKISKNTEYSVSYSESTELNSISLHQSNEKTTTIEDNILEENYNDIQINGKIQDESITSTDSGNILEDNNKEEKNTKVAENIETQIINEVSHGPVKRSRGRPKKKLFEIQGNLEISKSSDENNLCEKTSASKNLIQRQLFISIDRITKSAEDNDSNEEISERCNEENIPNKANAIMENYNEIQINIEKSDESMTCTDSEISFHENISNNQEPTKRKRGRPKKKKELKLEYESKNMNNKPEQSMENHDDEVQINKQMNDESISRNDSEVLIEKQNNSDLANQELVKTKEWSPQKIIESSQYENGSEIKTYIDKDTQPLSGKYDESNVIEKDSVVKNGKLFNNYQEKTKNNAKEGSAQTEICTSSVINDDNLHQTTDSSRELQFSEPKNTLVIEEKQNYGESIIKKKDGKKGLHDELQMVEYFQDTKLDEKTGQLIGDLQNEQTYDEKFGPKFESDRKSSDIDLLPEFKFKKLVLDSENHQIHHLTIDEKNLNDQKLDKAIAVPEAMTSLGEISSTDSTTKIKETCNTNITKEYSDFGYDIHRRTSFRKILERVMEVSRSEMEMAMSETMEKQRCKSVPPKVFHDKIETNILKCASADSKFKYLQNKNSHAKADFSKVKKCLDFNSQSKFQDKNIVSRKWTKSFHEASEKLSDTSINPKPGKNVYLEPIKSSINGVVSTINHSKNSTDKDPKEIIISEGFEAGPKKNMDKSHSKSIENESQLEHMLDSRLKMVSSEKYIENHKEQEILLLEDTPANAPHERYRSKSFSEGKSLQKFHPRTKSVLGRKFKNRNRTSGGMSGSTEVVKKVYEFKVGDAVWGKVGKYPYWPGLVMEDPETSDFKKFRLLRTNPYYHIRFFGDKGKRAWTAYCIPYEGSEDLDNLQKQFSMEGHQNDYSVKAAHMGKWKKAVQEAEIVKNYSIEKKIEFFEKILPSKERIHTLEKTETIPTENYQRRRSKSFSSPANILKSTITKPENHNTQKEKIPMKTSSLISCIESVVKNYTELSSKSDCDVSSSRNKNSPIKNNSLSCDGNFTNSEENLKKTSIETSTDVSPPKKRNIAMKDSSVIACIDDVVKKFCSANIHNSDENYTQRKKSRESKRKIQDSDNDIDVGLELLDIPAVDMIDSQLAELKLPEQNSFCKSPEQSISNRTPVSSRKAGVNSPSRTRLRSSLKLDKRRLSNEFNLEGESSVSSKESKVNSELSCSPRRLKLKRRTIEIGRIQSETESNADSYIKNITTRLPEHKKNLFRGVTKEKVCQICEKPGDVVKCRGPCNGDFHIKCVESSLKETEELTLKEQQDLKINEKLEIRNSPLEVSLEDNKQVEISTVRSRKQFATNVVLSPINRKIPIMEQFDRKMKELMCQVESRISIDSTDTSSEDIDTSQKVKVDKKSIGKNTKKFKGLFKHVTADDVSVINLSDVDTIEQKDTLGEFVEQTSMADEGVYKCSYCTSTVIPPCFVCNSIMSKSGSTMRQRCSLQKCGRYYHLECLNVWHQTQWSFILHDKKKTEALDSFVCPRHSCHICASENLGFSMGRCPNDKLVKCLRCPATYHNSYHCVPAGTDILTSTQIICPRHVEGNKKSNTLNTIWCFVCSEGGNLICCETCPTSVHSECLPVNLLDDDTYICEDCESGRFPLYDEVVWVKCGTFRWWPAIILFPAEVPANVESKPHKKGEFVVKFFGTYNYFWVGRGRTFLYQEGDTGCLNNTKNKIDEAFIRALKEAADVYNFKKGLRAKKQKEVNNGLKPPPYVRIKVNRPVGNVRVFEGNLSNTTPCDCNPKDKNPCGPNSNCLNRLLLTECNPEICPAGERCKNQAFEKREYPQVKPYRTAGRGWGLKALEPIKKGQFVIEYVGELIDDEEYQRRITRMHQQKDENYYFLTIDNNRMLDAGPKGNAARFMNHSCNPNCETQKWTVNGDTRVGLFAIENISVDTELTFNYNLECVGTEKKICRCGAVNCSGFIGVKPEDQRSIKKNTSAKPVDQERPTKSVVKDTCFICGKPGDVGKCTHKTCLNSYHLECVQLDSWPEGKWKCPSHTCNVCSKSTSRICVHCNNSYCSNHLEGNIRLDDTLGYLCSEHDQARKKSTRRKNGTLDASSSNSLNKSSSQNEMSSETLRSERYRKRTSCFESNIPEKKLKLND